MIASYRALQESGKDVLPAMLEDLRKGFEDDYGVASFLDVAIAGYAEVESLFAKMKGRAATLTTLITGLRGSS